MNNLLHFWQLWGASMIGALLTAIVVGFVVRFVLPAWRLDGRLHQAIGQLQQLAGQDSPAERAQRTGDIMATPQLAPLWREYAQSLHRYDAAGQPTRWRTTALAAQFFSEQALVDTPLKTGFYKHLPGILTGIGIIGTFSGLIAGLGGFQVSSDSEAVRSSLHGLIVGVGHAFEISAVAITLAMLFTWVEKSLTTRLYRRVERLCQLIDSLFEAGLGEDYLARLVRASETATSQNAQLRQALVGELRLGLQSLLAEQQASAAAQQQAMARQMAEALAQTLQTALREPLSRISEAVEKLAANQGATLGQALQQTLQGFSQRLDQSFGQRQNSLENLLTQTSQALAKVTAELGAVGTRLESAGRGAVDVAAGQLQTASSGVAQSGAAFARSSRDMAQAAAAMTAAAQTASQSLIEQGRLQESIARMIGDLRSTVDTARRDAALTSELVGRLEQGAAALGQAQRQAGDYLQEVNQVLGEAHAAFAEHVEQTLSRGNGQFQRSVVGAVEALEGAIEEFSDALASGRSSR